MEELTADFHGSTQLRYFRFYIGVVVEKQKQKSDTDSDPDTDLVRYSRMYSLGTRVLIFVRIS